MSKFNAKEDRPGATSPVTTTGPATTHEGGAGFARDAQGDLYLLAVTNMVAESTFYEKAEDRDARFADLTRTVALASPSWVIGFFPWLRSSGFMRSASVVGAAEAAKALCANGRQAGVADMIDGSLQRPDEVGEFLAYWVSIGGKLNWHRSIQAVKEGLSRAALRMYTERNWLKYDSQRNLYTFDRVIQILHLAPSSPEQRMLFKYVLDARYQGGAVGIPNELIMISAQAAWRAQADRLRQGSVPAANKDTILAGLLSPSRIRLAGLTWEDVLSQLGGVLDKRDLWQSVIPAMGVMALCRNLRNFDESGLPDVVADQVARKISDPEEVAKSKMFPFRFLAAHQAVGSVRWALALEKALAASLDNVPELKGNTLILVDRSGSMWSGISEKTQLNRADSAAVFGSALALRAQKAKLVEFGTRHKEIRFRKGDSVLRMVEKFGSLGGTNTASAVKAHFSGHDRVVIITDEQTWQGQGDVSSMIPKSIPLYTWNLAGYRIAHGRSGGDNRHTFGGLSDASFRLIPLLEAKRNAFWPWEK